MTTVDLKPTNPAPAPELASALTAETVDSLIVAAGSAEGTMYAKVREAAKLAAPELDGTIAAVGDRVDAVVLRHKAAFDSVSHNVKAIFKDCLMIYAAPATVVEVPVVGAPKTAGESATKASVPASDALTMSKNVLRDVAKQVRESCGIKSNRTGRTKSAAATPAPAPAPAATFFDELRIKCDQPEELAKIIAVLDLAGYTVKAKAGKSLPAKAAAPAPSGSLAADLAKVTS